ncbi:MAG: ion transporter [Nanoarchaeota archaeon]
MKPWLHKVEVLVDKSIPYLVLILLILIILDVFYHEKILPYENQILVLDYFIVIIFIMDLGFKYYRVKSAKEFLKKYWIDIIVVIPFFLIFRLVEEIMLLTRVSGALGESQTFLHTGVEIGRIAKEGGEEAKVLKEIQEATKLERTARIARIVRPVERAPRIWRMLHFYEKPYNKTRNT